MASNPFVQNLISVLVLLLLALFIWSKVTGKPIGELIRTILGREK